MGQPSPKAAVRVEWSIYIVRCRDSTLYCGMTTDVARRLRQHNGELKGGAKYTKTRRPVSLVFHREMGTRSAAAVEEAKIKRMNRAQKEQYMRTEWNRH